MPNDTRPCAFKTCPAIVERLGNTYCPVHRPEALLNRVRSIVQRYTSRRSGDGFDTMQRLMAIEDAILHDLDRTL